MKKLIAIAATTVLALGAGSVAQANGTVKPCPPVHHPHKHHPHHPHHKHHAHHVAQPVCCCPPALHTGFFGGIEGGYGIGKGRLRQDSDLNTISHRADLGFDGGLVGLFLGYDYYFCNKWVLGLEGSVKWTDFEGKNRVSDSEGFAFSKHKTKDSYTIALRLGHTFIRDCLLVYGKAGAEFTRLHLKSGLGTPGLLLAHAKKNKVRSGYLLGAGFETPFHACWTWGAEYTFSQYQRVKASNTFTTVDGVTHTFHTRVRPYINQFMIKIAYRP